MNRLFIFITILASSGILFAQSLEEQFKAADAKLNQVYKELRSKLNEQQKAELKKVQMAWLKEIYKTADQASTPQQRQQHLIQVTIERTQALRNAFVQDTHSSAPQQKQSLSSGSAFQTSDAKLTLQQKANREHNLAALEQADEALNAVYKGALRLLSPAEQNKLRQDQRKWLAQASGGVSFDQHRDLVNARNLLTARSIELKNMIVAGRRDLSASTPRAVDRLSVQMTQYYDSFNYNDAIKKEYYYWLSYLQCSLSETEKISFQKDALAFEQGLAQSGDPQQLFNKFKEQIAELLIKYKKPQSKWAIINAPLAKKNFDAEGFASISDDASLVVTASNHSIRLWDAKTGLIITSYSFRGCICGVQFDLAGKSIYVMHHDELDRFGGIEISRLALASGDITPSIASVRYGSIFGTAPAAFLNPVTGQCHVVYHEYNEAAKIDLLACKRFQINLGVLPETNPIIPQTENPPPIYDRQGEKPDEVDMNYFLFGEIENAIGKAVFYLATTRQSPGRTSGILAEPRETVLTVKGRNQRATIISLSREGAVLKTESGLLVVINPYKKRETLLPSGQNQGTNIDYIRYEAANDSLVIGDFQEKLDEFGALEHMESRSFSSVKILSLLSAKMQDAQTLPDRPQVLKKGSIPESISPLGAKAIISEQAQTYNSISDQHNPSVTFGKSPQYYLYPSQFIGRSVDRIGLEWKGASYMSYWPQVSWSPTGDAVMFYGARFKGVLTDAYLFQVAQKNGSVILKPFSEWQSNDSERSFVGMAEISLGFFPCILHFRNGWVGSVSSRDRKLVSEVGTITGSPTWEGAGEYPAFDLDRQKRRIFNLSASGGVDVLSLDLDGKLGKILEIFPSITGATFVAPDGFFLSRAINSLKPHFTFGFQTYPPEQFDLRLNRPDIVLERLGAPVEAISIAKQLRDKRLKRMGVTEDMLLPDFHLPEIEIVGDLPSSIAESELALKIKASDSKYPLNRLRLYVNNVPVNGKEGELLRDAKSQNLERTIPIKLAVGRNKIQVSVVNSAGAESLYANAEVTCTAQRSKPTLYAVATGVSEYTNPQWNLKYAAKDARDILERVKARSGSSYGEIKDLLLTDREVTKESLGKIREFLSKATVDDTVLLFVAGHGLLDSKYDYYFGTSDIDFENPSANGIAFEEFDDLLAELPCLRKSLLIDTCHAGELDEDEKKMLAGAQANPSQVVAMLPTGARGMTIKPIEGARGKSEWYDRLQGLFVDLRRGSGSTILSSSAGAEYALESSEQKNGLFTYAVLEALDGKEGSDANKDGSVTMSELADYVKTRVAALTNNKQSPNVRRVNLEGDFALSKK
jgi:uncharacterized protein YecT (DUF1311 family)